MITTNSPLTNSPLDLVSGTKQGSKSANELSTFDRLRGSTYANEFAPNRMEPPPQHPTSAGGGKPSHPSESNSSTTTIATPPSGQVSQQLLDFVASIYDQINEPNEGTASISVDGNTISWPDDGWYEVQSATSHNTISEGGQSADLPAGTYIVINHTTGERFEDIQVGPGDIFQPNTPFGTGDILLPDVHPLPPMPGAEMRPAELSMTNEVQISSEIM